MSASRSVCHDGVGTLVKATRRAAPCVFRWLVAAVLVVPAPLAARQATDVILPSERYFEGPLADPLEPRLSIGLLLTDVLSAQGGERPELADLGVPSEWQAAAAVGATIPMLRVLGRPEGGIVVSGQAGVFGRFRIERPSRDDLGQDWIVAMPIEAAWNELSARIRIVHRSAHLGDEFSADTGAERIEFGGEGVDVLIGRRWGSTRFYGGGELIFHSNTNTVRAQRQSGRSDRLRMQLGFDGEWRFGASDRGHIVAGVDWQSAQRTGWRRAFAGAIGLGYRSGQRSVGFMIRLFDGASPMGQFFLTPETYLSGEFNVTL